MTFARVRALIIVGVLFVAASVTVVLALTKDTQSRFHLGGQCPAGMVPVSLTLPEHHKDVKLNVYNGTRIVGLANRVGTEFSNREFNVQKMRDAPGRKIYDTIAEIHYGPRTVGAAWLMRAYFLGEAEMVFDLKRKDDVVDVIVGTQFQQLATTTEVNQSIAQLGTPDLPPGTCDVSKA
jgi:LytR cell envelope-related transcriptional attenuator